ncbi:hypothetical protein [Nocardioides sp. LHG3406-4]|uniref:hypothetical protein n=1 Tax=Nocardioides sp. LHG3406-4 TaxID=2804575 RepID=UPI003CE7BAEB
MALHTPEIELTWATELDRLELELCQIERHQLDSATGTFDHQPALGWEEPRDLGPIPPALMPRARQILVRQQQLAAGLTDALQRVMRQQRYTARVTQAVNAAQLPVYLDITA